MKEPLIWLSISIFCNKQNWNKVLNDGIAPFAANNSIENYIIEFNYLSGDNIRLQILTDQTEAPLLSKKIDSYFKIYFSESNLPKFPIEVPFSGLFKPFPENTICYGLYFPRTISNKEKPLYEIPMQLSNILLAALRESVINNEVLLTFAFYLKMAYIKASGLNNMQLLISPVAHQYSGDNKSIEIAFNKNKENLIEITRDIFVPTVYTDTPDWLKRWLQLCEKVVTNQKNMASNAGYGEMSGLINRQLSLSKKMDALLTYFIEHMADGAFKKTQSKIKISANPSFLDSTL